MDSDAFYSPSEAFRRAREGSGMSQAAVAAAAGMKQPAVARLERSDYQRWTWRTIERVAAAMGMRAVLRFEPVPTEQAENQASSTNSPI